MAEIKLSQLPEVSSLSPTDILPNVASGVTSKITVQNLAATMPQVSSSISASNALTSSYVINGVTGNATNGQVAYWTSTNSQTGSNNLFWDSTNRRLGVGGITSPLNRIHIRSGGLIQDSTNEDSFISTYYPYFDNILVGSSPYSTLAIKNRTATGVSGIFLYNSSDEAGAVFGINNPSHPDAPNQLYFWNYLNAGIRFGTNNTEKVRITPDGKLLVGTTSSVLLLDISGSGRFTNGLQVTGSLNARVITGSLFGTASWAINVVNGGGGTFPYNGDAVITGSLLVTNQTNSVLFKAFSNLDVDTGTEIVASLPTASFDAIFFDYVAKDGTNYRAGTVVTVWSSTTWSYTDTSVTDIGDTSALTLDSDVNSGNARLKATVTSDNWTIKTFARSI